MTNRTSTTQFAWNGDGVTTSKTVGGDTTEYVLDPMAMLPVVISDTEAVYLHGLDVAPPPTSMPPPSRGGPSRWLVVRALARTEGLKPSLRTLRGFSTPPGMPIAFDRAMW